MAKSLFPRTRWSLVRQGGAGARPALEELARLYGPPLTLYYLRCGFTREDAQDLRQQTFERILKGRLLEKADPEVGRFRVYVMRVVQGQIAEAHARRRKIERDARQRLDEGTSGECEGFDDVWVSHQLELAMSDFVSQGGETAQQALRAFRMHLEKGLTHEEISRSLGVSASLARLWSSRAREGIRQCLLARIQETCAAQEDYVPEATYVLDLLKRRRRGS